jgi:predicted 2-oxoglutarate/Fe(II)-dependent dioxygenase YbiX
MPGEIKLIRLSSLKKVFLDEKPEEDYAGGSMLINEKYSFQIAFTVTNIPRNACYAKLKIRR